MNSTNEETPGMSCNSTEGYDQVGGQLVGIKVIYSDANSPELTPIQLEVESALHPLYVYRHIDTENLTNKDKFTIKTPDLQAFWGPGCLSVSCLPFGGQNSAGQALKVGEFDE